MYKIYINDNPLFLAGKEDAAALRQRFPGCLTGIYTGQVKSLLHYIDLLEKASSPMVVVIYSADLRQLAADFYSLFRYVEAAGGLVFNALGRALFIFRRGKWDLPKGKLTPGEQPLQGALREIQEETGLGVLKPGPLLTTTFHTYRVGGQRVLKRTHWFLVETTETGLVPQAEEDIEKAVWNEISFLDDQKGVTYDNILDVIEAYRKWNEEKFNKEF